MLVFVRVKWLSCKIHPPPKVPPFIWMDLQIQTLIIQGIIRNWNPREGSIVISWTRHQGQPSLTEGQSSQFNTLHKVVSWLGCLFRRDLEPVQKVFQARSCGLATDTYYNHFFRQRRAGTQCRGCYRGDFENLRVLTLPWLLNMRRGSNLYPGSNTPGVRQFGPEQDCNIISR